MELCADTFAQPQRCKDCKVSHLYRNKPKGPDLVRPVVAPVVVPVAVCPVHPVLALIVEHVVRKRVFKAWIKNWEWDCFDKKEDPEPMRHLVLKYHGLHWLDGTDVQVAECEV
jgi:hypothetical protein